MFPQLPSDLSALSDAELAELRDQLAAYAAEARNGALTDEVIANLTRAAEGGEALAAEVETRATAAADRQAQADALAARLDAAFSTTDPVPDNPGAEPSVPDPAQPADPQPQPDPAPVTAGATPAPVRTRPVSPPLSALQPTVPAVPNRSERIYLPSTITAGGDIPGYGTGQELQGLPDIAKAISARFRGLGRSTAAVDERISVATVHAQFPADRHLSIANSELANMRMVDAVASPAAITAAGGLCAPVTPYYDIQVLADSSRPVRDALTVFSADRGGVRLVAPPQFSAVQSQARVVADGVTTNTSPNVTSVLANFSPFDVGATITGTGIPASTVIIAVAPASNQATLSNNATATGTSISFTITRPGTTGLITDTVDASALNGTAAQTAAAVKPCMHVTCPGVTEVHVSAITRCLEFGNFTARAYPEEVEAWTKLALAWQARFAENNLLTQIGAASTQVTQAAVLGIARELPSVLTKAAAYVRNHNRMNPELKLRALIPAWVVDAAATDLMFGSGYTADYYRQARQSFMDALSAANLNITYYWDSGTGQAQLLNSGTAQGAGAIAAWPSTTVVYLFPEGSFLFLDGGTLDLGVVRDSTLNSQNNYRIFAESFENVVFVGLESLALTVTESVTGTFGPAGAAVSGF